jgi:integrase
MAAIKMHLAKAKINGLPAQTERLVVHDDELAGFHLLILPSGCRTFYLHRRTRDGRQFKLRIGRYGEISAETARNEAKRLCAELALGRDPALARRLARLKRKGWEAAPTVAELWTAFSGAHSGIWRDATAHAYGSWFRTHIEPALGSMKAHEVQPSDIRKLYAALVRRAPATAQQVLRVASSMFAWAVSHDELPLITANPCTGAIANGLRGPGAQKRERYPIGDELPRLVAALTARDDLPAKFFLLLLLTGARRGELKAARWVDFDLEAAVWIKPASTVKQKKLHRLPLNPEAVAVLRGVREASPFAPWMKLTEARLDSAWKAICAEANIVNLRVHDLRHWHASVAASSGESLLVIGGLLGHSQASTTHRYSHLVDDAVRVASAKVGATVLSLAGRRS